MPACVPKEHVAMYVRVNTNEIYHKNVFGNQTVIPETMSDYFLTH